MKNLCKNCVYEKKCKDKPKEKCLKYLAYEESEKYQAFRRMMEDNLGVRMDG